MWARPEFPFPEVSSLATPIQISLLRPETEFGRHFAIAFYGSRQTREQPAPLQNTVARAIVTAFEITSQTEPASGGTQMKKVASIVFLVLAVPFLALAGIRAPQAPNISYLVGSFLPGMLCLIVGLALRQTGKR